MLSFIILLVVFFLQGASPDASSCSNPAKVIISTPTNIEALRGTCLLIPCTFSPKEDGKFTGTEASFGVWIKKHPKFKDNPSNVIFNSSGSVNTYKMELIGNLNQKNCTTLFHKLPEIRTETFYFRVESKNFSATASCDPIKITVKDSPQKPVINTSADAKDLKENQSVTISCSASTPCPQFPPNLTWNLQQDSPRHTEENKDGSFTSKIHQSITLSHTHDGYKITCSATYSVDGGRHVKTSVTQETLSVSYAPKSTSASISPSGLVPAGSLVELSCSSKAKPPVNSFTWFKTSTFKEEKVATGEIYSFNATEGGFYYCIAENNLGRQKSSSIYLDNGESNQFSSLVAAVGVVTVIILLICGFFLLRWLKNKHKTFPHNESMDLREAVRTPEKMDIHYGEIDFSKLKPSSDLVQNNSHPQEVVYSQVHVKMGSCSNQSDIYAQIKKK